MNTELMDEILQSETAQRTITYVSPIYGSSYVMLWIFEVIGEELDDINTRSGEIADQAFPQLATWGINYLEDQYGIIPPAGATLDDRRRALLSFIHSRRPMNPVKIEQMVTAATGRPIKVNERVAKRTFEIVIDISSDAPPLDIGKIINLIDRVKPAHLLYRLMMAIYGEIKISLIWDKHIFQPPLCGTLKSYNILYKSTLGEIISGIINVAVQSAAAAFEPPSCNDIVCGVYPSTSTVSYIVSGGITGSTAYARANSNPPLCNTIVCGEVA